jgi:hypothetical protein
MESCPAVPLVPALDEQGDRVPPRPETLAQFVEHLEILADYSDDATVGRLFRSIVEHYELVYIARTVGEWGMEYQVTVAGEDGKRRNVLRDDLKTALKATCGIHPTKRCYRCHTPKPVTEFSHLAESKDGRNRYCKACERARVAVADAKKKAKKAQKLLRARKQVSPAPPAPGLSLAAVPPAPAAPPGPPAPPPAAS